MRQAVRLGDVEHLVHLEIACRRCDRHGRMRIAKPLGMPVRSVLSGVVLPSPSASFAMSSTLEKLAPERALGRGRRA